MRRFLLSTTVVVCFALPARAGVLDDIRTSIGRLWGQKGTVQQKARAARAEASALNAKAGDLADELEATQRALQQSNEEYFSLWRQMKKTEARIVKSRHRVTIVTARYNARRARFGHRLAAMQQTGQMSYLQMFLGSRTLSDLTRRAQLYQTITENDAGLQAGLLRDKTELQEANATLQRQWHHRNSLQREAGRERRRIILAETRRSETLNKILRSRNAMLAYSQAQEQSSKEIEGMIGDLTSRRAEIIAQYDAQAAAERAARRERFVADDGPHYTERRVRRRRVTRRVRSVRYVRQSSGELKPMQVSQLKTFTVTEPVEDLGGHSADDGHDHSGWFRPVSGRMSSRYGMRYHPILRRRKMHTGQDIAAGQGTPFRAAREGRVLWSGWKKAYGNTVIIDHGDGTQSLYGHASKLGVRAGQPVRAGEYIGNVGSTGYSTGPHLHFEVRKNGRPVNPRAYVR
ncbi:MAG TPA: peptidoglycan DD-metalloendopeptidase family protein [Abditibacteriaceae bacterium]|jgi:murein DD-endopeptidase MepM/ murein hydrolase activator NlpD